jgi:hypothetical protein
MTRVYLHAGLPKTGTTTIQNWLVENASRLRGRGVYTVSPSDLGHRLAVEAITSPERRAESDVRHITTWPLDEARRELRQAAQDAAIRMIVLSSEYFSIADPAVVKRHLGDLSLADVKIILVLRRQDRLIESGYNQDVRMMGRALPIGGAVYHEAHDWDRLTTSWANVFSPENLVLRLYNESLGQGEIISFTFSGIDPLFMELSREHPPYEERSNLSLPSALIEFKRLANCAGAHDVLPLLEKACQRDLGGPPFRMAREVAKGFLDIYRESNRKVAREFFQSNGDLFDESDLEGEPTGADNTGNLPVETLAVLLALYMGEHAEQAKRLSDAVERLEAKVESALAKLRQTQES